MVGADSLLGAQNPRLMVMGAARVVWSGERVDVGELGWIGTIPHPGVGTGLNNRRTREWAAGLGNARGWECWEGPALLSPCTNNWRESFSWTGCILYIFLTCFFRLESSEQDEPG